MTILEIMERTNARDTKLVTAFVKDAIMKIQSSTEMETKVNKQDITKYVRDYDLPDDMVEIHSVSVLDTEDDNKYKKIRRLAQEPNISEDTNP